MSRFTPGQSIKIRSKIQQGAFPGEFLVSFETAEGPISGFVREQDVERIDDGSGYIAGIIKEERGDTVTVMVRGSFFTTTGLANLKREWADSHVELASA